MLRRIGSICYQALPLELPSASVIGELCFTIAGHGSHSDDAVAIRAVTMLPPLSPRTCSRGPSEWPRRRTDVPRQEIDHRCERI
jgi:hypothetical protein